MGSCTRRHFLLSTCFLQLVTIIERQVFDFLGYMWTPILANFFHIIFVIFGFYGAYHFRAKYIITYLIWSFIWIGWNTFLICFYLDIGILNKNSDILNLGTGSVSWFEVNGYGCKPIYPINITSEDPYRPVRPEQVDDCLIDYPIVEVIHSGIQCILSLLAILGAILIAQIFLDEDDRFDFMGGDAKSPQHTSVHPMYVSYSSIPTSASGTLLSNKHNLNIDKMKSNSTQLITTNLNDNSLSKTATIQKTMNTTNKTPRNNINNSNNNNNNNSNNNINNSNIKNSNYSNFINRPDIKYTQISTEQLMVNNPITDLLDDSNDNFSLRTFKIDQTCNTYIPFQKPVPILYLNNDKNLSRNSSTTTTQYLDNRINDINSITEINTINNSNNSNIITNPFLQNENSLKPQQQEMLSNNFKKKHFSQLKHQELLLKKNPPNHFHNNCYYQPYPDLSPEIPEIPENYVMPDQYVTRSPNLNRISSRRRQDKSHITNFCDQIRDAPPGYNDAYMSRAKSHDRLSYRNRRQNYNKNPRPRSYCNNSNNNNNNNNMNGTGLVGVNGICGDDDADYGFGNF